ncbi:hypothetical protein AYO52_10835 [Dietzia sp. 111N12-1]|nr:hypothetical protein AYO52_10835 [Dietzia sp. 111N12-1]
MSEIAYSGDRMVDSGSVLPTGVNTAQCVKNCSLGLQFPLGTEACCSLLLEKSHISVVRKQVIDGPALVSPRDLLVKVVAVLMVAFRESSNQKPADSCLAVYPDPAPPLRLFDLQERQPCRASYGPDVVVVVVVGAEGLHRLRNDRMRKFTEWM